MQKDKAPSDDILQSKIVEESSYPELTRFYCILDPNDNRKIINTAYLAAASDEPSTEQNE